MNAKKCFRIRYNYVGFIQRAMLTFARLHLSTLFALAKPLPCFPDPFLFVMFPTLNVFGSIWTRSSFVVDESAFSGCNV